MVAYIRSDLEFILEQIKIAEAHAAGTPLFGPAGLFRLTTSRLGLRTVDGTYNNLLPGQEQWGAADIPFPEPLGTDFRPATAQWWTSTARARRLPSRPRRHMRRPTTRIRSSPMAASAPSPT